MENWINKREDFVISKSRFTLKLRYNYYNMSRSNIFIPINQRKQRYCIIYYKNILTSKSPIYFSDLIFPLHVRFR